MERRKDLSYLTVAWLVAVAIAGLLSMHGLDPAVFQRDQGSSRGVHDADAAEQGLHAAIGLCVFAIATSLGLALATSTAQPRGLRTLPSPCDAIGARSPVLAASGRQRLADLCVLRL